MSTVRKMRGKFQCMVRLKGHPDLSKSFVKFSDAQRWGLETELIGGKCVKQVPIDDVAKRATVWIIRNHSKWFEKLPDSIGGLRWKPKDIGRKYVPFYSDSRTEKVFESYLKELEYIK